MMSPNAPHFSLPPVKKDDSKYVNESNSRASREPTDSHCPSSFYYLFLYNPRPTNASGMLPRIVYAPFPLSFFLSLSHCFAQGPGAVPGYTVKLGTILVPRGPCCFRELIVLSVSVTHPSRGTPEFQAVCRVY